MNLYDAPNMLALSVICVIISIAILSASKAQYRRIEKRYRQEQKEMLKWQIELEKKASNIKHK